MKLSKFSILLCGIVLFCVAGCGTTVNKEDIGLTPTTAVITSSAEETEKPERTEPVKATEEPSNTPEITKPAEPTEKVENTPTPTEKPEDRILSYDIEEMKKKYEATDVLFSCEGGVYEEEFLLELTCESNGKIYYTTDGSDPALSDTAVLYENKIEIRDRKGDKNVLSAVDTSLFCTGYSTIEKGKVVCYQKPPANSDVDKCTVIRAALKTEEGNFGKTITNTYFIGKTEEHIEGIKESCEAAGRPLAVISISIDYDDLFGSTRGIYVKGKIFEVAYSTYLTKNPSATAEDARKIDANYSQRGRAWERPIHMEMYEMDEEGTTLVLSTDCGIRIQGNYSRSDLQKGLRLYARSDYGDKKFKYEIFGDDAQNADGTIIGKFDTLVLRAGGNTTFQAKYNDTYWQNVMSDLDVATKASRPCVVYINGEYFGLYVLEEDYSQDYFESHYGVNADDVVVYKGDAESYSCGYKLDEGEPPEGEGDDFYLKQLMSFFNEYEDLKSEKAYTKFAELVDIESVRDYFASEIWIDNKWDWPGKNWVLWKTSSVDATNMYADGRWRFAMLDLDFGGVSGKGDATTNTIKADNYKPLGLLDKNTSNPVVLMFAYLMTNDEFVKEFEQTLLESKDTTFKKDRLLFLLNEYEGVYGPLFNQFFKRYPDTGSANVSLYGGYASSKCIRDFVGSRAENIQKMIDWIEKNKQ